MHCISLLLYIDKNYVIYENELDYINLTEHYSSGSDTLKGATDDYMNNAKIIMDRAMIGKFIEYSRGSFHILS